MAHHNSAVYDVGELDQTIIDAAWQKPRHPYTNFHRAALGSRHLTWQRLTLV